jgi:hypothetical protein
MALKAGVVQAMPDLACIGLVKKVGEVYLSTKEVYHVLPVEIEAKFGGRDGLFFYLFQPSWFGAKFDPETLLKEDKKGTRYGMYRRYVNDEKRPSVLACLVGEEFDKLAAEFDALGEVNEKHVEEIIRQYAVGRDVGYVMTQRTDPETKELMEQYNIKSFFPLTDEELKRVTEQAGSEKRRKPLVVTWDE